MIRLSLIFAAYTLLGIAWVLWALLDDFRSFDDAHMDDELRNILRDAADDGIAPELLVPSVFLSAIFLWPYFLILQIVGQE
jgi:hypothetical protein